jgi:serine O-acetyltransferase
VTFSSSAASNQALEVGDTESSQVVPSHDDPPARGDRNQNPTDIGLLALIAEDFRTHDRMLSEPGFWVVALHRLANARMDISVKALRAPLTLAYLIAEKLVNWMWGIQLPYPVKVGRRLRIWHHGGTVLGARAIGDDVHIRHNTTFGVLSRGETAKPIIGNRVDIGVGAVILGPVTIGDDAIVGPNSVVLRHVPPGAVVMGIPARQAALKGDPVRAASPAHVNGGSREGSEP